MKAFHTVCFCLLTWLAHGQTQIGGDLLGNEEGEQWGFSTALAGDGGLLAISGPFLGNSQGGYTIYADLLGNWTAQWAIGGIEGGASGLAIDLSDDGQVTVIGTPGTTQGQFNAFVKSGTQYTTYGDGVLGPESLGSLFGAALSLSGDGQILAVGARSFDASGEDDGYVEVFEFISGQWVTMGSPLTGEGSFGEFGRSLDLSSDGGTLVVGNPYTIDNRGIGSAQVFDFDGDDWQMIGQSIEGAEDLTGYDVAISSDGQRVVVGAPGSNKANVYEYEGSSWNQVGGDITISTSTVSGFSVDISGDGNRVLIGALGSNAQSLPGSVAVFDFDGSDWELNSEVLIGAVGEAYGWNVELSADGNVFTIGVPGSDSGGADVGRVEIYEIDPVSTRVLTHTTEDISLAPNPAQDFVLIKGDDLNKTRTVEVVNMLGQPMLSTHLRGGRLDITYLPAGTYQILLPVADYRVSQKLVVF